MASVVRWVVGDSRSFVKTVTDEDVRLFAQVSGDHNPIHLDDGYAAQTRFKKRIAHGALLASYISNIIGNEIPGAGSIYLSSSLRFRAPTFVGDTVTTLATVAAIRDDKPIFTLACECSNQVGEVLCSGEAVVLYEP
jgi:3-hydroxybutyryl-CoA dehydratase